MGIKDTASSLQSSMAPGGDQSGDSGKRCKRCREFLELIDTNGLLSKAANEELPDEARLERLRRLDRVARTMDERRYADFSRARQVALC